MIERRLIRTSLLLMVWMFATQAFAQQPYDLRLRTGALAFPENAASFARSYAPEKFSVFEGRYHLLVQFYAIPTVEAKGRMEGMGVQFLEYLPQLTYVVSVPEGLDLTRLENVRGFMEPSAENQLSKDLFNGRYPDYARHGDQVSVEVMPYRGIRAAQILPDLQSRYALVNEYPHPYRVNILVRPSEIPALIKLPYVAFVEAVAPAPTPDDIKGRSLHRSNVINSDYGAGRHYDGTGVTVGLADDGIIGPHIDYTGRLTNYATGNTGNHGDMTAGIMFGAGNRDPEIRGHATGAQMHYWDIGGYVHILDAVQHFNTNGVILTSTSYSQGQGGVYTTDSQFIDDQIYNNRQLEHMFSAGNAGTADHGYGAGAGWGNITGGYKAAKSVITCGNLTNLAVLDATSSRGPADDGRIKPDICANGTNQLSTDAPNTNQVGGGTSAASPSVAGCVTQLYHAYKSLNGNANPESGLIKACILNTGTDLGNPGPDYRHGWGHINSLRAVRVLETNRYLKDSVSQGQTRTHNLTIPAGTSELRVMVYWSDYPGNPAATKALVNDLNMTVTNGTVYQPWVLNPAPNATTLNANAVRGVDDLNNMEQVTIANPTAGPATVTITGTTVPFGPQTYFVVYEFVNDFVEVTYPVGGEGLVPGGSEVIRWDANGTTSAFTLQYSTNNGSSWNAIASNIPATTRMYTWTVPTVITGQALVRVTSGSLTDDSDAPFTIARVPTNITVTYVCPDSIGLSWTAAAGSSGYEVSHLGALYMDSVAVTSGTTAVVYGLNPLQTHWFSVSSLTADGGQGKRAVAIEYTNGIFNCTIPVDIGVEAILSPGAGNVPSCQASATTPVIVRLRNNGTSPASNIPVSYTLNGGAPVNEVVAGPIASGAFLDYTFTSTVNLSAAGSYTIGVTANFPSDGNGFNDSLGVSLTIVNSTSQSVPLTQDFESFALCGTASDCEAEVCALGNGWVNSGNGVEDDIDWRVSQGSTPSANTGPDQDHNPGTSAGNYVYLEPSNGCTGREAYLISPCISLVGTTSPQVTYWYHMYGADMGTLHIDVMADGVWNLDVVPAITGDQGNQWRLGSASLVAYVGKTVNIRWRGETGADFTSDMALDDILVSEANSAPIVTFMGTPTTTCVGSTVAFSDMSANNPTSWSWSFSPSNVTYVGGTSATSQNPQVQFGASGTYSVSLSATNGFGSASSTQTGYITVVNASSAPVIEPFNTFTPTGWSVIQSAAPSWVQATGIVGANGQNTSAATFDNFTYNSVGSEDLLVTMPIDMNNTSTATLTFDLSYAEYGANFPDHLRIDVSTDCGSTWIQTGYDKTGAALATAGTSTAAFTPTAANQWRNESVNLSTWTGNTVKVAFVNVNGYGNNIFIDNVNISTAVGLNPVFGSAWNVYPNPNNGQFTLIVDELPFGETKMEVRDLAGRIVFMQELKGNGGRYLQEMRLDAVASGVYTIALTNNGKREVRKLTIQ